jgi:hypothetical protein
MARHASFAWDAAAIRSVEVNPAEKLVMAPPGVHGWGRNEVR